MISSNSAFSTIKNKLKVKNIPLIFKNKLFLTVLVIKIALAFFFGSEYFIKGTIPFVNYFIESGFQNPYSFFATSVEGFVGFPYPSFMLFTFALFRYFFDFMLPSQWYLVTPLHLFITRIPMLLADITIFYILVKLLRSKEKLVLLLYWCSPILIYITYFHGQLDVIPIALLFLSLYLIYQNRFIMSSILLGLGIATKTHLILILPFYFIYLWKQRLNFKKVMGYFSLTILAYLIPLLPYLTSKSFFQLVFLVKTQFDLFNVSLNLGSLNVNLFLVPALFLTTLFIITTYKNINKELFFMIVAFIFSILLIFISPRPGWYYWAVPFIVFFLIREGKRSHFLVYGFLNLSYLAYFLFYPQSDIFRSLALISPQIASLPAPYALVQSWGLNADLISNILLTILTTTLIILVYWIYQLGIKINLKYNLAENPFTVGIGGDSGSGKTTLSKLISSLTGKNNRSIVSGDDVHKWERGDPHWKKLTHLHPKANQLFLNFKHAKDIAQGDHIYRRHYDHNTGKFTSPHKIFPKRFVIFEGLHPFFSLNISKIYDFKIFMDVNESLRKEWKIKRDTKKRAYSQQKILAQLKKREPDSKAFIQPQAKYADIIIKYRPLRKNNDFLITIESKHHLDFDSLSEKIKNANTFHFQYDYQKKSGNQFCQFYGTIPIEKIEKIAFDMVPELRNLLNNFKPSWEKDKNGILQLIILMYINEILTLRKTKNE